MTLRTKLATILGSAAAAAAGYAAFGPIFETVYFRTDIGSEAEGLFLSETPTDLSTTSVRWVLLGFVAACLVLSSILAATAYLDFRSNASNRSEGST